MQINIVDATNGIFMNGNEFITASDISFSITADRGRNSMATRRVHGHHAMQMAHGSCECRCAPQGLCSARCIAATRGCLPAPALRLRPHLQRCMRRPAYICPWTPSKHYTVER